MRPSVDWNLFGKYGRIMPLWQWGVVIIVGCVFVWLMFKLRDLFREDAGRDDDAFEMLTQFRDLHRQGDLSEEEYRLIKSRLISGKGSSLEEVVGAGRPANDAQTHASTNRIVGPGQGNDDESSSLEKSPNLTQAGFARMQAKATEDETKTETEHDEENSGRSPDSSQ